MPKQVFQHRRNNREGAEAAEGGDREEDLKYLNLIEKCI